MSNIQKPFLKWIGGKSDILDSIIQNLPKECNNYHELFLGGGSVLFGVLSMQKCGKLTIKNNIYAYDINKSLIDTYKTIQNKPKELHNKITEVFNEYNIIPNLKSENEHSKEKMYYTLRTQFNTTKDLFTKSYLFIVLNKLCFRGMFREGPNGFNVPFGHYKNINFIPLKEFIQISELIKNVNFICKDFVESIKDINKDDFVYLDPPYMPLNKTSFVKYTKNDFNLETHSLLFNNVLNFNNKDIKFIMSNNDLDSLKEIFKDFTIQIINCKRRINSKNPGSSINELIIKNLFDKIE